MWEAGRPEGEGAEERLCRPSTSLPCVVGLDSDRCGLSVKSMCLAGVGKPIPFIYDSRILNFITQFNLYHIGNYMRKDGDTCF